MLVDANLLLYATNERARQHERASAWLTTQLAGSRRVGIPWQSIATFLRLSTHARVLPKPSTPERAWADVAKWLESPVAWHPTPGPDHGRIVQSVLEESGATGNVVPDAMLAALAVEHGLTVMSADSDFARFPNVRWENPLVG